MEIRYRPGVRKETSAPPVELVCAVYRIAPDSTATAASGIWNPSVVRTCTATEQQSAGSCEKAREITAAKRIAETHTLSKEMGRPFE